MRCTLPGQGQGYLVQMNEKCDLGHRDAGLNMQQLGLGAGVEEEGVGAEGEGAISAIGVVRLVMGLPPGHVVVLHVQLLTAPMPTWYRKPCEASCTYCLSLTASLQQLQTRPMLHVHA